MKYTALTIILSFCLSNSYAQSKPSQLRFEEAEKFYANQDYKGAINKLNQAEQLSKGTTAKILYLKIASRNALLETSAAKSLQSIAALRGDISTYLTKYTGNDEKYRQVFELNEKYANYNISLKRVEQAEKGDTDAMLEVANIHYENISYAQALEWYKKAADKGSALANFKIGYLYDNGEGVKKDYKLAMESYKIAEEKKLPEAMAAIGWLYYNGHGVKKDKARAIEYFKTVLPIYKEKADKGDITAMQGISAFYLQGEVLPKDFAKSFEWSMKAANAGSARSMCEVGLYYQLGYGVKKDYEKSVEWMIKSAGRGFSFAMMCLGGAYYSGIGVTKNDAKAIEWLLKAADHGNAEAMVNAGVFYFQGIGVPANSEKGVALFLQAADRGNMDALVTLGNAYRDATGVPRSYAKAKECYQRAIMETDDVAALRHLGALYYEFDGYGNSIDYVKALEYYNRAAIKGDGVSMKRISEIYAKGKGVKKDKKLAKEWLDKSESAEIKQ